MSKYEALFTPFQIGSMTVKNRMVLTAMGGTSPISEMRGTYGFKESVVDYYMDRAKGNIGLIIPGVTHIWDIASGSWLYEAEDLFRGPLKKLMEDIHAYGSKFVLQLGLGFGRAQMMFPGMMENPEFAKNAYAASDGMPNVWFPEVKHRGLTVQEIDDIVEGYGKTALLCKEAGIDGVELHAVHEGYLLDQFTVAATNGRTDEYGGSLENRMRFVTRVIRSIKEKCGEDYPVLVRYSVASKMRGFNQGALPGENYVEFGRSLEESPAVARALEAAGCDALDADNGSYDSWWWAHPPVYMPLSCNLPEVSYIKNFVNIPVICAGRMEDPETANEAIASGKIDGVGMARQFLCDPEWVNKVHDGNIEDIRPCIACHNGCFAIGKIMDRSEPFGMGQCALNPRTMHEKQYEIKPAEVRKKVVVVGGGIGGMEAARIAALRGHDVSLYEKTDRLGGAFIAAAAPDFKEKDKMLLDWCIRQTKAAGVQIFMNTEVTAKMLKNAGADEIIVATGAAPRKLSIPGYEKGVEAIDCLLENKAVGENAVIVGGGLTGCEIAYDLAKKGKKVTILEMQDDILQVPGLCAANSNMLREIIRYYQIGVQVKAVVTEICDDGAKALVDGKEVFFPADTVIISAGYVPEDRSALVEGLENVHFIGDAVKVKNLKYVFRTAWETAFAI